MACLTASKRDYQLLGETEFQMRDILLRIGARTLEAAVKERRKKGGTEGAAPPVKSVIETPDSWAGDPRPFSACSG